VLPVLHAWSKIIGASALYTRQSVDNLLYSNRKIDHAKARRELGYHSRPLTETIRDTIAWFANPQSQQWHSFSCVIKNKKQ
jgi:dihydroflavonol-4-reductase